MIPQPNSAPVRQLDVSAALAALAGGAVLLDVREPYETAAGHAPQAVRLPMGQLTLDTVPAGVPLVIICRSGNRSDYVAAALRRAGFEADNLAGGMLAWQRAGQPVVRGDGAPGVVA